MTIDERNDILVTIIIYYGNNQAIPIIGNVVLRNNCIIIHQMNTFTHYMNLLYAKLCYTCDISSIAMF